MPTYRAIASTETDPEAPITSALMKAVENNPLAIAEGDPTAPVNAYAWHPFNKVTVGDSNTGVIWSFAANGAVAAVTSPDFADGWDYGFWFERVGGSSGSVTNFNANLWRETTGAYAGVMNFSSVAGSLFTTGFAAISGARLVRTVHGFGSEYAISSTAIANAISGTSTTHLTAQKILRCQFTCTAGNITGTGAAIYMLRRRNVAT